MNPTEFLCSSIESVLLATFFSYLAAKQLKRKKENPVDSIRRLIYFSLSTARCAKITKSEKGVLRFLNEKSPPPLISFFFMRQK